MHERAVERDDEQGIVAGRGARNVRGVSRYLGYGRSASMGLDVRRKSTAIREPRRELARQAFGVEVALAGEAPHLAAGDRVEDAARERAHDGVAQGALAGGGEVAGRFAERGADERAGGVADVLDRDGALERHAGGGRTARGSACGCSPGRRW